jgi:hypothetical protein
MQASLRERSRIARHIRRAESRARTRDLSTLTRVQRLIRELLLGEVAAYVEDGRFPKNREFPWKMPVFVDGEGTRCAMAHLMEVGGAADLVERIRNTSNFAFVRELAHMPEVASWLEAAGLDVDEAALIQPQYCQSSYSDCLCDESWSQPYPQASGVLEVTITAAQTARIDAVYGDGLGHQVGDVIGVYETSVGATMLIPLQKASDAGVADAGAGDAGAAGAHCNECLTGVKLDAAGRPSGCSWNETVKKLPISKQQAADALRAKSCSSSLQSVDPGWQQKPPCSSGCNTSGEAPESVAILLSVVSAVVALRAARNARKRG